MFGTSPTNVLIKDKDHRFIKADFCNLLFLGEIIETSLIPNRLKYLVVFYIFKKEVVSLSLASISSEARSRVEEAAGRIAST
jgi:hypothetical protein